MSASFAKLNDLVVDAVERCLHRSLLSPSSVSFLAPDNHAEINSEFSFLSSIRADSTDGFLTRGSDVRKYDGLVVGSGPDVSTKQTRISKIISKYLSDSAPKTSLRESRIDGIKNQKDSKFKNVTASTTSHFVSPYAIALQIMTDPDAIETREIVRFFNKLRLMKIHEISIDLQELKLSESHVSFADLDGLYKTLQRYVHGRDNYSKPSDSKSSFLLEFTASLGYLTQRLPISNFQIKGKSKEEVSADITSRSNIYFQGNLAKFKKEILSKGEFRINSKYVELPSLAEISNRVFGIPVALSGFTDLLKGGLKQGAGEGTVSLIRGGAGTGKTTLAISMQRAVEALGIPSVFVTSEETIAAIRARRESALSLSQKMHSQFSQQSKLHKIIRAPSGNLREPAEVDFEHGLVPSSPLFAVLDGIIDGLSDKPEWPHGATDFTKLFVVFDGVHNFLRDDSERDDYQLLKSFVERCRDTGVQILLTSSKDWMVDEGFEYLVDNYFTLTSEIIEEPVPHFDRKFQIIKTRHQGSMAGNHRMTIGDEGELQFQPNFSELLKRQSRRALVDPANSQHSLPFVEFEKERYYSAKQTFNDLQGLKHFQNSSSLIYGIGSSSKADLAFRLLATPDVPEKPRTKKVLVVSFLASRKYYDSCASRHNRWLEKRGFENERLEVECMFFAPGMISADEVYFQISSKLEFSETTLNEYDGVLIDGIHNVFVQFPMLMGKPELWTALTGLFRRSALNFVLTYSDFDIAPATLLEGGNYGSERATPLMVALTQSLDYGFNIIPRYLAQRERQKRKNEQSAFVYAPGAFELSCFIAHGQQISGDSFLVWDKEKRSLNATDDHS